METTAKINKNIYDQTLTAHEIVDGKRTGRKLVTEVYDGSDDGDPDLAFMLRNRGREVEVNHEFFNNC
jgi:hypothetical protein